MNKRMEKVVHSTLGEPMPELFKTGFERFWDAWPRSTRKGGKSECQKKWVKLYCETHADQIIKHVEWMKTTDQWRKSDGAFIPAPLVYLNQQRWDGAEIPEEQPAREYIDPALRKIEEDRKKAAKPSAEVQARINEILKGKVA